MDADQPSASILYSSVDSVAAEVLEDSIMMDSILNGTLELAMKENRKTHRTEIVVGGIPVSIGYSIDEFFNKGREHLILQRFFRGDRYLDIFILGDDNFESVFSHQEWGLTHVQDSIWDINGDGLADIEVKGYGSSGCCLKAYSRVFLQSDSMNMFLDEIFFLNPTFDATNGAVRGVDYGHEGMTTLYKYEWDGTLIDTIERVGFERLEDDYMIRTGRILITDLQNNVTLSVAQVPIEYEEIMGFDWFMGE